MDDGHQAQRRKLRLEQAGASFATRLGIDVAAFGVGSNLHWAGTLMKLHLERGPLRDLSLSMPEFVTLWTVRVGGEMSTTELASEVGVPPSSFTSIIARLEARGLAARRRHATDGRSTLVSITPAGRTLVSKAFRRVNRESHQMTDQLTDDERARLAELLRRVADRLSDLIEQ